VWVLGMMMGEARLKFEGVRGEDWKAVTTAHMARHADRASVRHRLSLDSLYCL
jgi:hypothetical protein